MHANKTTFGNAVMMGWELSAVMSALHLALVICVELPALIQNTHVVWDVSIQFLQPQPPPPQQLHHHLHHHLLPHHLLLLHHHLVFLLHPKLLLLKEKQ